MDSHQNHNILGRVPRENIGQFDAPGLELSGLLVNDLGHKIVTIRNPHLRNLILDIVDVERA